DDQLDFAISQILSIFYKDDIEQLTEQLYTRLRSKIVDINTIKVLSKKWVNNVIKFVNLDKKFYAIDNFKWKFTGKSALILGAGPSLADNLEKIKLMRDKFTIFAVNKSLEFLEKNEIIPDFAVFADATAVKKNYNLSDEYTSKLNIIADWKAESAIAEFKSKNHIVYFSDNELFIKKYAKELDIQLLPAEQTTSLISLMSANFMGFEKIYFCGFDLAFKEKQPYADVESIDIENDKAIINKQEKQIIEVPSITGDMVQTREDYAVFIKAIETIIKTRGLKNLYNITEFGALIEGMNYTSFDNINIYGEKADIDYEISKFTPCQKDFRKFMDIEKSVIINIHENIMKHSPLNLVINKITNDSTLLYEYLQLELIELSRDMTNQEVIDNFYSKTILAIDKLLAIMN
ncbi:MAG: 6-hydroxymethylpterin diphosphokinase MptE-like protein, partial [Candidatus Gastranaerophilaceae bacterium]